MSTRGRTLSFLATLLLASCTLFSTASSPLTPEQVLQQAVALARALPDERQRHSALSEVLGAAERMKAVDLLLQAAREAPEVRPQALQAVVPLLAASGRVEEALAHWRQMRDASERLKTLANVYATAVVERQQDSARQLFALAQGKSQQTRLLEEAVRRLLDNENPQEALRYALKIPLEPQRSVQLAWVADSLARCDKLTLALQAASQVRLGKGYRLERFAMNLSLAAALARTGKLPQAMARLRQAVDEAQRIPLKEGLLRDEQLAAIPWETPVVFSPQQWRALAARIRHPDERSLFLRAVCRRYAEEGQWQHARTTAGMIPTAGGRLTALVMLADMAREAGKTEEAPSLLRQAEALIPRIRDAEEREAAFRALAVAWAASGNLPRAVELAGNASEPFERFAVVGSLLEEAKGRTLRPEERAALRQLAQMALSAREPELPKKLGFELSLQFVPVIRAGVALALAGDVEGVRQLLQRYAPGTEREGVLRGILAELSSEQLYHRVPVTEYPVLHWLGGGKIPEKVPSDRHRALLRQLIDALAPPTVQPQLRREYLQEFPEPSTGAAPDVQALSPAERRNLTWHLIRAGRLEEATRLAQEEQNSFARAGLLCLIAEELLKVDRVDDALRLLRDHQVLSYWGRSEVLSLLVQKGRYDAAVQLVQDVPLQIDNPLTGKPMPVRPSWKASLAESLWEQGQRDRAQALLQETLQEVQSAPPSAEEVHLLLHIARMLTEWQKKSRP